MRIIAVATLKSFWQQSHYRDVEQPLRTWVAVVKAARWTSPADIRTAFNSADILKGGRVIFDIGGNKYRLIAQINFRAQILYVRFIGTHRQYDQVDAQTV